MALLSELTGIQESLLGQLRYPDAQRVLDEFGAHLPNDLREQIFRARQLGEPARPEVEQADAAEHPAPDQEGEGDPTLGLDLSDGRN
jgi:hypothetical protein